MNTIQEILIQDTQKTLLQIVENLKGKGNIDEVFVAWLLSESYSEMTLKEAGIVSSTRIGGNRGYSDIAILGYCADAGLISSNIISALKDGLEWLSGRSITVQGISTGLSQDPIALLGIALGTRIISEDNLMKRISDWLGNFISQSYKMRGIEDWQKCVIVAAGQILQIDSEISIPANKDIDDVLVALKARKTLSFQDQTDKEVSALYYLKSNDFTDVEPIRAALSLAAYNSIKSRQDEVSSPIRKNSMYNENKKIKVLFLAASPSDETHLQLDVEHREISEKLRKSQYRDVFELKSEWAVRISDLAGYLMEHKPDIVHFSGHGSNDHEIILLDKNNESHPVSSEKLSELFSILKDNIRCVILNACYSEEQAKSIANHIDCVIGMSDAIGDASAIIFASHFYQALAFGRSIEDGFKLGCLQIDMENLDEGSTPKLICNRNNANQIHLC